MLKHIFCKLVNAIIKLFVSLHSYPILAGFDFVRHLSVITRIRISWSLRSKDLKWKVLIWTEKQGCVCLDEWMCVCCISCVFVCVFYLFIFCLSVCVLLYPFVCLPVSLSACLLFFLTLTVYLSVYLPVCFFLSLSVSLSFSVYPSVCLSSLRPWSCLLSQVYEMRAA